MSVPSASSSSSTTHPPTVDATSKAEETTKKVDRITAEVITRARYHTGLGIRKPSDRTDPTPSLLGS